MSIIRMTVNGCSDDWNHVTRCGTPLSRILKSFFFRFAMNRPWRSSTETGVVTIVVSTRISSSSGRFLPGGGGGGASAEERSEGGVVERSVTAGGFFAVERRVSPFIDGAVRERVERVCAKTAGAATTRHNMRQASLIMAKRPP